MSDIVDLTGGDDAGIRAKTKENERPKKRTKVDSDSKFISLCDDKEEILETDGRDSDSDLEIVSLSNKSSASNNVPLVAGDDECGIVSESNPLINMPHSRYNCILHPFHAGRDNTMFCTNCYCFVCDDLASKCTKWPTHSNATSSYHWRQQRQIWLSNKNKKKQKTNNSTSSSNTNNSHSRPNSGNVIRNPLSNSLSREQALAAFRNSSYNTYRRTSTTTPTTSSSNTNSNGAVNQLSDYMKHIEQTFPVGSTTTPEAMHPYCELRNYQKESLAFMLRNETSTDASFQGTPHSQYRGATYHNIGSYVVRGGILADEVGMGKTVVCIALILSNPFQGPRISDSQWKPKIGGKVKTTLISTTPTLLGQWYDEFNKYAPQLKVAVAHSSGNKFVNWRRQLGNDTLDLRNYDVLLLSNYYSHKIFRNSLHFHRIILDECHDGKRSMKNARHASTYRWCVTGTPVISGFTALDNMFSWLGRSPTSGVMYEHHIRQHTNYTRKATSSDAFKKYIKDVQNIVIRHSKLQKIDGEVALKLPEMKVDTIWLTLTHSERESYSHANDANPLSSSNPFQRNGRFIMRRNRSYKMFNIQLGLHLKRNFCSTTKSKLDALLKALLELRAREPDFRAIVFSELGQAQRTVESKLKAANIRVFVLNTSATMRQRHEFIREFQAQSGERVRPTVIIASMKIGNVGITLTKASMVYILEPPIDKSMEVQAAGRIHRLGQDKPVEVKRFCLRDTVEDQIIKLHQRLDNGSIKIKDDIYPASATNLLMEK